MGFEPRTLELWSLRPTIELQRISKQNDILYKSKPLFPPSRLCVHVFVRSFVTKIFFRLNRLEITPWLWKSTPGVDPG